MDLVINTHQHNEIFLVKVFIKGSYFARHRAVIAAPLDLRYNHSIVLCYSCPFRSALNTIHENLWKWKLYKTEIDFGTMVATFRGHSLKCFSEFDIANYMESFQIVIISIDIKEYILSLRDVCDLLVVVVLASLEVVS